MNQPCCYHCGGALTNAYCEPCGEYYSQHEPGPAPKEERMICVDCGKICDSPICDFCNEKRQVRWDASATLRDHYNAAYLAALGGLAATMEHGCVDSVDMSHQHALESVRSHAARLAELERVIEEVTNG